MNLKYLGLQFLHVLAGFFSCLNRKLSLLLSLLLSVVVFGFAFVFFSLMEGK